MLRAGRRIGAAALLAAAASASSLAQPADGPAEARVDLYAGGDIGLHWAGHGDARQIMPLCVHSPTGRARLVLSVNRLTPSQDAPPMVFRLTDASGREFELGPIRSGVAEWAIAADEAPCSGPNAQLSVVLPGRDAYTSVSGIHDVALSLSVAPN